jgi:NAD(P)-dependent dehydrogenase (short-subunit alcohol dehydrogenase family)
MRSCPAPWRVREYERVLEGRAKLSGKSVEEEKQSAMSIQSLQRFVDPRDIAALAVFLTSDAGKSISGVDNDTQKAS